MDFNKNIETVKTLTLTGWTSYVLIAVGLLVILFITAFAAKSWVGNMATKMTAKIPLVNKQIECQTIADVNRKAYINEQRRDIVGYAETHRDTAIQFYGFFYATFAVFSVFGLLAAIALAVITKSGINNASPHLITVFLVATAIVISYQGFFGVFQQKNNLENNAKLYVSYAKLVNQIDTYCATGKLTVKDPNSSFKDLFPKSEPKTTPANTAEKMKSNENAPPTDAPPKLAPFFVALEPDEFINYVNWQMEQYKAVSIAIDDTKIASIDKSQFLISP